MLNIYLNTWANYNENGADGGEWITLPMSDEELKETMESIFSKMGDFDPEPFINDYEWTIELDYEVNENDSIEEWNDTLNAIDSLDKWELKTLEAMAETGYYSDLSEMLENLDNVTFYEDMDLEDVAYEIVNECYFTKETPDFFERYFDYKAFARDLSFDNYYEVSNGTIYIG